MKPAPIAHFLSASSADDASRQIVAAQGIAVVIAGGQSLIPMLALRVAPADSLVHVGRIEGLRGVIPIAGGIRIGAAVTHAEIEDGRVAGSAGGFMRRVAGGIAYRAVRNHGTIGGSMGLADPAADWPVALLALDARVNISGPGGARVEAADQFLHGAYATSLAQGEIITSFDVPEPSASTRFGYVKVARKSGAFAMSIGCVVRRPGQAVSVVVGGMQQRAWRLEATERIAAGGGTGSEDTLRAAIAADIAKAEPDTDAYQVRLHTATVLKALREAS